MAEQVLARPRASSTCSSTTRGSARRCPASGERVVSDDGYELRFAVNYLAGVPADADAEQLLIDSAPARVVTVSSLGQMPIDFDDVMLERHYSGMRAYCQSKLAQVMFTFDLADELATAASPPTACIRPPSCRRRWCSRPAGAASPRSRKASRRRSHLIPDPALDGVTGRFYNGLHRRGRIRRRSTRTRAGACASSPRDWSASPRRLSAVRPAAAAHGLRTAGDEVQHALDNLHNRARLLPSALEPFALYLARFLTSYRHLGIRVDAITPQKRSTSRPTVTYGLNHYQLGQVSKFVSPGAVRIASNTFVTNFRTPDGVYGHCRDSTTSRFATRTGASRWSPTKLASKVTFTVTEDGRSFRYSLPSRTQRRSRGETDAPGPGRVSPRSYRLGAAAAAGARDVRPPVARLAVERARLVWSERGWWSCWPPSWRTWWPSCAACRTP